MNFVATSEVTENTSIFEANLALLKQNFPHIYAMVAGYEPVFDGEVIQSANGMANLRYRLTIGAQFLAYDNEDPWQSAAVHLDIVPEDATGVAVFIGIGMGYGPLLVADKRPDLTKIVIVEPSLDVFCLALRHVDLMPLLRLSNLHLYIGEPNLERMELELAREVAISDTYILKHMPSFTWRTKEYEAVNQQVFQLLNKINTMGSTTRAYGRMFVKNRLANLTNIRCATNTDILKDAFKGVPALLVAAGPSLDMSIPDIQRAQGKCIIFAVDSAVNTLMRHGIVPDFISALDMEMANFEKLASFLNGECPANLVITIKVSSLIPKRFPARHMFYAFNEDLPHMWVIRQLGIKHLLPTLLSVAHLSVGMAHLMGASPLVLVGQDLAYTKAVGSDHASGVIFHEKGLPKDKEIFYVKSIAGDEIPTDRGLLSLKQQFEEIVAQSPVPVINASAMGAHIEGTEVMQLKEVVERFMTQEVNVNSVLNRAIEAHRPWQNTQISRHAFKSLLTLKDVLNKVEKARKILAKAILEVEGLLKKGRKPSSLHDLPSRLQDELLKAHRLNEQTDGYEEFWNQVLELTYDMLKENDKRRAQNERLKEKEGYLPWLQAELLRLLNVQQRRSDVLQEYGELLTRLVNRLEEEDRLLKAIDRTREPDKLYELKLSLALLYVESDDLQLALPVLTELVQLRPEDAEAHLLLGYVKAGLLNFDEANRYFEHASRSSLEMQAQAVHWKEKAVEPWLFLVLHKDTSSQKNGAYLLWGEKYPHLLKKWIDRIQKVDLPQATNRLVQEGWPVYKACLERLLKEEHWEKAETILSVWRAVASKGFLETLSGYALLQLKVAYHRENVQEIQELLEMAEKEAQGNADHMAFVARVLLEYGDMAKGISLLGEAVKLNSETATLWEELGDALVESQDYEGAIAAYERCFVALPAKLELLKKMGDCYLELGQVEAAKTAYEAFKQRFQQQNLSAQALEQAEALFQNGLQMQRNCQLEEAVANYKQAVQLVPEHVSAWMNMGVALSALKRHVEAENAFREALKHDEKNVDVLYNLACLYLEHDKYEEAKAILSQVIELQPDYASAYNNLGHIYKEYEQNFQKAIECFEHTLKFYAHRNDFDEARAYYNTGNCYQELLDMPKAIKYYTKAIELEPNFVEAHWNLSHVFLLTGQIERGFQEYLWRWRRKEAASQDPVSIPRWNGEPQSGRILVWAEQGAGDNIQFVRYLPLLKKQGKEVILACDASLAWLFQGMASVDRVVIKTHLPVVCHEMDWHVPLLNLPTLLQKEHEPFPATNGYLPADTRLFERFEGLFKPFVHRLKVGFVWKGNPKHNRDKERSVSFEMFKPLFALPDTAWFSLQYQSDVLPVMEPNVVNLAPYLFDFAHTAALVCHLDLIITVDTSMAHLAGAVVPPNGQKRCQVWTLLTHLPDWRWGLHTQNTPWYDNMRLFRQKNRGDWQGVFEQVKEAIISLC